MISMIKVNAQILIKIAFRVLRSENSTNRRHCASLQSQKILLTCVNFTTLCHVDSFLAPILISSQQISIICSFWMHACCRVCRPLPVHLKSNLSKYHNMFVYWCSFADGDDDVITYRKSIRAGLWETPSDLINDENSERELGGKPWKVIKSNCVLKTSGIIHLLIFWSFSTSNIIIVGLI